MEVFPYRRQVMRVAIVHIGYGPDERDPFAQPPPYGSLLLRRSRQPQTSSRPTRRRNADLPHSEIEGLPDRSSPRRMRDAKFGARPEKAMNMPVSHIGLMYRSLGWGIVIGAARRRF
jgi:hypothetical protein